MRVHDEAIAIPGISVRGERRQSFITRYRFVGVFISLLVFERMNSSSAEVAQEEARGGVSDEAQKRYLR
ncbi:hypothetical protein KCP76_08645 [Salmonella enterica subsp. enterica serovar Weltevreden]|nr:hypothetical protein KCP76_08645 [Salmonella enterica subsp. enterica serovar Weltevreden]